MVESCCSFRETIEQLKIILYQLQEKTNSLNDLLSQQNLDNALGIFINRSNKLRERALAVRATLMKIKRAGEDMEENHTYDENEFVETLAAEMP